MTRGKDLVQPGLQDKLTKLATEAVTFDDVFKLKKIKQGDGATLDRCAVALRTIVALRKEGKAKKEEVAGPLRSATKAYNQQFKEFDGPLERHEKYIRSLRTAYIKEAEAKRAKKIERKVEKLEAKGEDRLAIDVARAELAAPAAPEAEAAGMKVRQYWRARVISKAKLIAAIAAGKVSTDVVKVQQIELNAYARANQEHEDGVYGLQVYRETVEGVST